MLERGCHHALFLSEGHFVLRDDAVERTGLGPVLLNGVGRRQGLTRLRYFPDRPLSI